MNGNLIGIWREAWRPPDRRPPWAWAEEHIGSIPYSPIPVRFRSDNSPQIREPLEALIDPRVRLMFIIAAIQAGKTSVGELGFCHIIANLPGPTLWLDQTGGSARCQARPAARRVPRVGAALAYLHKNSGFVRELVGKMAIYATGDRIKPQALSGNPDWNKAAEEYFARWAAHCEITNRFCFAECQALVCRGMDVDGEYFVHKARNADGGLRLQLIESHRIGDADRGDTEDGIGFDEYGAPAFYRVLLDDGTFENVPAHLILHVFEPEYASAVRQAPTVQHSTNHLLDEMELLALEKHAVKANADVARVLKTERGELDEDGDFSIGNKNAGAGELSDPGALQKIVGGHETAADRELHLILDNYATHKHPKVKAWLKKHPRFHLHFTPTSASWLNMVETGWQVCRMSGPAIANAVPFVADGQQFRSFNAITARPSDEAGQLAIGTTRHQSLAKLLALAAIVLRKWAPFFKQPSGNMFKLRHAPFAAIALFTAIAVAQQPAPSTSAKPDAAKVKAVATESTPAKRAPVPVRRAIAKATPVPVATPVPKKAGFWERVFGKKKPAPAPATPTPAPVIKKKVVKPRAKTPKTEVVNSDEDASAPEKTPKVEATKPPEDSTPPTTTEEKPKLSTPKPGKGKGTAQRAENFPPSTDNADAEIVEKQKYDQAKAKAVADPKVQELRGKADAAPSEDESRKALRAYNKAMFKRMKEIDPSIKDHVERMEAAVMSRLGGE